MNGQSPLTILVVGATGSVGRHVVADALANGHHVRALVRDPARARLPSSVTLITGDLTKPATLPPAVEGVDAVVFTHSAAGGESGARDIFYAGVRDVLAALGGRPVRIALMTAIGVTDRGRSHDWQRRAERLVRASGLPYVIVRPGWFDLNEPDQVRLVFLQGDRRRTRSPRDGVVSRRQIAEVLVNGLSVGGPPGKTFELVAETGPRPTMAPLFAGIDDDRVGGLDGARDEANMPIHEEPANVIDDLNHMRGLGE